VGPQRTSGMQKIKLNLNLNLNLKAYLEALGGPPADLGHAELDAGPTGHGAHVDLF
jgi:hypothetical protein